MEAFGLFCGIALRNVYQALHPIRGFFSPRFADFIPNIMPTYLNVYRRLNLILILDELGAFSMRWRVKLKPGVRYKMVAQIMLRTYDVKSVFSENKDRI